MKILLLITTIINGGFMLIDGIYVLLKGKYIGPEKPGPWSMLFSSLGINVFKLGPLFVIYGLAWLSFAYALITKQSWATTLGMTLGIATLWYLPIGTAISIFTIIVILLGKV